MQYEKHAWKSALNDGFNMNLFKLSLSKQIPRAHLLKNRIE